MHLRRHGIKELLGVPASPIVNQLCNALSKGELWLAQEGAFDSLGRLLPQRLEKADHQCIAQVNGTLRLD